MFGFCDDFAWSCEKIKRTGPRVMSHGLKTITINLKVYWTWEPPASFFFLFFFFFWLCRKCFLGQQRGLRLKHKLHGRVVRFHGSVCKATINSGLTGSPPLIVGLILQPTCRTQRVLLMTSLVTQAPLYWILHGHIDPVSAQLFMAAVRDPDTHAKLTCALV